jgi:hypothetical protein
MFTTRVGLIAAAALLYTAPAWAQETPNLRFLAKTEATAEQGGAAGSPRKYIPRVFAGLWTSAGDGFQLGAGISTRPFTEEKHEVQGNVSYLRVEGTNGFSFDADYLYNFAPPSDSTITPFAAAGLNITRFSFDCGDFDDIFDIDCSSTDSALQIGGGLKRPLEGGKEFFAELYFVLSDSDPIIIRAGVGW